MNNKNNRPTVVITGATSAVGIELVKLFASKNFDLALLMHQNNRKKKEIEQYLDQYCSQINYSFFQGSLESKEYINSIAPQIKKDFGTVFALINNAAIILNKPIIKCLDSDFASIYEINLKANFIITKQILKLMIKQKNGHIVNISSIQALKGAAYNSIYSASKAGLIAFSKSIALEYGNKNIKSNVILPGFIDSQMTSNLSKKFKKNVVESNCLKRINDPKEIAQFIYYLTTTNNISGQIFNLDSRILP